ncbi:MAG TPA: hypothetical protein VMC08_03190 [Bacteroidales bacterium]|nr:hypothetical protein [Bacteroidales bacterium]
MKKSILLCTILLCAIVIPVVAQEEKPEKVKEIGLSFYNLNSFGVRYKTGTSKMLLRMNLVALDLGYLKSNTETFDSVPVKLGHFGVGFNLGFEKRIPVVKNLDFLIGLDLGANYGYSWNKQTDTPSYYLYKVTTWSITPMLDLVLGLNYHIGKKFCLSAEFDPYLSFTYGHFTTVKQYQESSDENKTTYIHREVGFGASNTSASITLSYVIGK